VGWTYTHKQFGETIRQFFEKRFQPLEILDCAVINLREVYMAGRNPKSSNPGQIFAIVCLINFCPKDRAGFSFGYKDMDETMVPCQHNCPERILSLLTTIDSEYANGWRQACWDRIARIKARPSIRKGTIIAFQREISFSNGRGNRILRAVEPMRHLFEDENGNRFILSKRGLNSVPWKIISQEEWDTEQRETRRKIIEEFNA
jgi:hypothetical protein